MMRAWLKRQEERQRRTIWGSVPFGEGLQVAPGPLSRDRGDWGKVWGFRIIDRWNSGENSGGSPWCCQGSGGHGSP